MPLKVFHSHPSALTATGDVYSAPSEISGKAAYGQRYASYSDLSPADINHVVGSARHTLLRNKVIYVTLLLAFGAPLFGIGLVNLGEVCEIRQDYYRLWPLVCGLILFGAGVWLIIALPNSYGWQTDQETYQASSSRSV